jgi:hypothetical protein
MLLWVMNLNFGGSEAAGPSGSPFFFRTFIMSRK